MFIWVKDPTSGHKFDVPETDQRIRDGMLKRVNDPRYQPSATARRPKHNINPRKGTIKKESQ